MVTPVMLWPQLEVVLEAMIMPVSEVSVVKVELVEVAVVAEAMVLAAHLPVVMELMDQQAEAHLIIILLQKLQKLKTISPK